MRPDERLIPIAAVKRPPACLTCTSPAAAAAAAKELPAGRQAKCVITEGGAGGSPRNPPLVPSPPPPAKGAFAGRAGRSRGADKAWRMGGNPAKDGLPPPRPARAASAAAWVRLAGFCSGGWLGLSISRRSRQAVAVEEEEAAEDFPSVSGIPHSLTHSAPRAGAGAACAAVDAAALCRREGSRPGLLAGSRRTAGEALAGAAAQAQCDLTASQFWLGQKPRRKGGGRCCC